LKLTNTVSPCRPPQMSHFGGTAKKIFSANAPTSSPQTSVQVSANELRIHAAVSNRHLLETSGALSSRIRKCQTPSKRRTDGRTDGRTDKKRVSLSVRLSVKIISGLCFHPWQNTCDSLLGSLEWLWAGARRISSLRFTNFCFALLQVLRICILVLF